MWDVVFFGWVAAMVLFGCIFTLTTYGESHGLGLGGIVDGCTAGIPLSAEYIQRELDRRHPLFFALALYQKRTVKLSLRTARTGGKKGRSANRP